MCDGEQTRLLRCPQIGVHQGHSAFHQEPFMLHYAVVFFVIALIAALFGFGGIAAGAVSIAKTLFFIFLVLAVASFLFALIKKR
jgi:uncharacterized membrane protein YtjA (UPF0391 family)